jgi:hypothetical protein
LNEARGQQIADLFFNFKFLVVRITIRADIDRGGVRKEVYLMIGVASWR